MIIYSVLTTCSFDSEDLMLFTSLRQAIKYASRQFDSAIQVMLPNEETREEEDNEILNQIYEEEYPRYHKVKADLNREEVWDKDEWTGAINGGTYDSFYCNIKRHNSLQKDEFNSFQCGGF